MPMYVANLERHLIPSPFLRINFLQSLQVILQAVAQKILMWSDSDHVVVIAHSVTVIYQRVTLVIQRKIII